MPKRIGSSIVLVANRGKSDEAAISRNLAGEPESVSSRTVRELTLSGSPKNIRNPHRTS